MLFFGVQTSGAGVTQDEEISLEQISRQQIVEQIGFLPSYRKSDMANYELLVPNFSLNVTMDRQLNYNFLNFQNYKLLMNYGFSSHSFCTFSSALQEYLYYSVPKFAFQSLHRIAAMLCSQEKHQQY